MSIREIGHKTAETIYFRFPQNNGLKTTNLSPYDEVFMVDDISEEKYFRTLKGCLDNPSFYFHEFPKIDLGLTSGDHPNLGPSIHNRREPHTYVSPIKTDYEESDIGSVKLFRAAERASTGVLYVPGWSGNDLSLEESFCDELSKSGFDVWLMTIPFQTERTPRGFRSGELYISEQILQTSYNMKHAVIEVRKLTQELKKRYEKVAWFGHSAGGFLTGQADLCGEEVDMNIFCLTGSNVADITWYGAFTKGIKQSLIQRGLDVDDLRKHWMLGDAQNFTGSGGGAKKYGFIISQRDLAIPTRYQIEWKRHIEQRQEDEFPTLEFPAGHGEFRFHTSRIVDWVAGELGGL